MYLTLDRKADLELFVELSSKRRGYDLKGLFGFTFLAVGALSFGLTLIAHAVKAFEKDSQLLLSGITRIPSPNTYLAFMVSAAFFSKS